MFRLSFLAASRRKPTEGPQRRWAGAAPGLGFWGAGTPTALQAPQFPEVTELQGLI